VPSATNAPSTTVDGAASVPGPQPLLSPKPAPVVVTLAPAATLAAPANGAPATSSVARMAGIFEFIANPLVQARGLRVAARS